MENSILFKKKHLIAIFTALLFMGCAGTKNAIISSNMTGNVKAPKELRIAVLPFEIPKTGQEEKGEYLRKQVFINLKRGGYNLVEPFVVDGALKKNDWNYPYLLEVAPQRLGEALGADAIIYGKLSNWDKSYLAIHSSITISAGIKLVDARSGEVLWQSDYKKTDFDGLFKVPTGITSAALSPILFITKKENQFKLANDVAGEMVAYLVDPKKIASPPHFEKPMLIASTEKALKEINKWSPAENRSAALLSENKGAVAFNSLKTEKESTNEPSPSKTSLAMLEKKPGVLDEKTYTIQVGAYLRKEKAQDLVKRLLGDALEAFISEVRVKGQTWHRVQIRTFNSVKEAEHFASEAIGVNGLHFFITPFQGIYEAPVG
jgi:hypothetical protein